MLPPFLLSVSALIKIICIRLIRESITKIIKDRQLIALEVQ